MGEIRGMFTEISDWAVLGSGGGVLAVLVAALLAWFLRAPPVDIDGIVAKLLAAHDTINAREQEIAALKAAVAAVRDQSGPGVAEALSRLEQGDSAAAEKLFSEVLERLEREGREALDQGREKLAEAATAARHIGAMAFLHDTDKALEAYAKAVELDPDNAEGWNRRGHLLMRIGDLPGADEAYGRVMELGEMAGDLTLIAATTGSKEGVASEYANLGALQEQRGDREGACAHWARAVALFAEVGAKPSEDEVRGWMRKAGCPPD